MSRRVPPHGGEVMRVTLQKMHLISEPWVHTSNVITASELRDFARKSRVDAQVTKHLEDYLSVMGWLNFPNIRRYIFIKCIV